MFVFKLFKFVSFLELFLQKFKFCGDADAPDFILAIIHSNLCGMSSIKLKVFASHVVEMITSGNVIDEQKFLATFDGSLENLKSAYACVEFLLLSAVRHGVTKEVFSIELQQLGFPKEHSMAMGKVLDEKASAVKSYLRGKSLSVNELKNVKFSKSDSGIDCVKMELDIANRNITKEIHISKEDIPILLKELKIIQSKMNEFNYE